MLGAILMMACGGFRYPATALAANDSGFGNAYASLGLVNDGTTTYATLGSGSGTLDNWVFPPTAGAAALHWCRLTGSGDTPDGSALNTWLQLSTTRGWSLTQAGFGFKAFAGTLEIARDSGGALIVASIPFNLDADAGSGP